MKQISENGLHPAKRLGAKQLQTKGHLKMTESEKPDLPTGNEPQPTAQRRLVPISETYDQVQECISKILKTQSTATTDDVRDQLDIDPVAGMQIGIAISHLAKQGIIVKVGYQPSRRIVSHGRVIAIWALANRN